MSGAAVVLVIGAVSLVVGFVAWTLAEYASHRFVMHHLGRPNPAANEHLLHHAQPARTRRAARILAHIAMTAAVILVAVAVSLLLPAGDASPLLVAPGDPVAPLVPSVGSVIIAGGALGFWFGYLGYEYFHFRSHHHRPLGSPASRVQRWDLQLRRRHFHHHFVAPKENLGVLVPWWDVVFGTEGPAQPIKVPRRLAMPWLVDDDGAVLPAYATTYVLAGQRILDADQLRQDHADAFANLPLSSD